MKTKLFSLIVLGLLLISTNTQVQGQSLFDTNTSQSSFDFSSKFAAETVDLRTYEINLEDYELDYSFEDAPTSVTEQDAQEIAMNYALNFIAFGAGFGINSDQTLWCLHAEYYLRLAMLKRAAVYGALGARYNASNSDFVNTTLFEVTLKFLMFSQLVKQYQQVRILYGLMAATGFGKEKFEDGFEYDVRRLSFGIVIGLQIMLAQQLALMIQTNLFNYQEQTLEYEDFERTDYSRWALINKNNLLTLSLIYTFGRSRR